MSVYAKKVTGQDYVYFQWYQNGKRIEEYVGRKDDPEVVAKLLGKFTEHQDYDLDKFCLRIQEITGFKIDPKEARRRLQESLSGKTLKTDRKLVPSTKEVNTVLRRKKSGRLEDKPESLEVKALIEEAYSAVLPIEVSRLAADDEFVELTGKIPRRLLKKLKGRK
jgi:hypothetical protein